MERLHLVISETGKHSRCGLARRDDRYPGNACAIQHPAKTTKAAQCEAMKVVGPHGLEPWTKGL